MDLQRVSPRARLLTPVAAGLALLTPVLRPGRASARTAPVLRLQPAAGSVVSSLSLPLGPDDFTSVPDVAAAQTAPLSTTPYSMVALTWRGEDAPLWVRTRTAGAWGEWSRLATLTDLPDPDSGEGNGTRGTELLWVGRSDGVQVGVRGRPPSDLTLELIDPGVLPGDSTEPPVDDPEADVAVRGTGAGTTSYGPTQPNLKYREQWGADESWRTSAPRYNKTIQQVHVHHTATGNDYERSDVPSLLRGIYRYHTHTLGWSDIGYNFLVDKFGRVWVGRAGGVAKPVRGAHTLGFNDTSVGVAMIGSYDKGWPWDKALTGVVMLAAWKLAMYDRKPTGWIPVYSHGSDKYAAGQWVTLPVIDGHRDTNDTECPGQHLYNKLPEIRDRAQRRVDAG